MYQDEDLMSTQDLEMRFSTVGIGNSFVTLVSRLVYI
jgi:hypothetical protein